MNNNHDNECVRNFNSTVKYLIMLMNYDLPTK